MPYDPSTAAGGATTDPSTTKTDVYGLSPSQENWTFYTGEDPGQESGRPIDTERFYRANDLPAPAPTAGQTKNRGDTALGLMKTFAAMGISSDPQVQAKFQGLQYQLLAAGFYGSGAVGASTLPFTPGHWTDADARALLNSFKAYQQVAGADGAGQPVTYAEYLNGAVKAATAGLGGGTPGVPSHPVLTDPDRLSMYAQRAAQAALGRDLTPSEIQQFISTFHQQETDSYQNSLHGKGDVIDKNDPRGSAIQFVTSQHPKEYQQHEVQGYVDSFLNMFLSGPSAAPNMNIDPTAVAY